MMSSVPADGLANSGAKPSASTAGYTCLKLFTDIICLFGVN